MRAGRGFAAFGAAWLIGWTSSEVGPQGPQTEPFQKEGYRKKGQIASASASLFLSPWAESVKGLWKERSASLIRAARMHRPSQATIAAPGAARSSCSKWSARPVVGASCVNTTASSPKRLRSRRSAGFLSRPKHISMPTASTN